ncbi:MAG: cbb3-type cytochrome c oxidase subunit 3 [Thiohalomonadales bacterium]|jgi:cytochrome c oxidase cbb3-type subunit 4|nr:cbb3-type cytochrome c oxidase subunit 3 [Thiohalomonadales bacterium]
MDINDIRSWYTVVMFVVFIGIVLWAWSGKTKRRFNEAAQLPFNEPEYPLDDKNKGDHHE